MIRAAFGQRWSKHIASAVLAGVVAVGLGGCAGYRLGSMLPPGIRTLHIPTVDNQTGEPLVETEVTRALMSRIQTDGTLRIDRDASADAVLHVVLREYLMEGIAFERGPSARPNEVRITLVADLSFMDARTGEILSRHTGARGSATTEFAGNASATKRNALPAVAEDLARDIVRRIVEAW